MYKALTLVGSFVNNHHHTNGKPKVLHADIASLKDSESTDIRQAEKYRIADSLEVAAERAEETRFAEQAFTLTTSHGQATHCFQ
jgi:hypothetical protein